MPFSSLTLIEPLLQALRDAGHLTPTPIQNEAIPALLAGRDVCGTAQTGTGKTAAFALPILQRLAMASVDAARPSAASPPPPDVPPAAPRALILAPTRELAVQIHAAFGVYGAHLPGIRCSVLYGSLGERAQRRALAGGVDILVATPGRLLDLCGQGRVSLGAATFFVLDEADRMLDAGFLTDVRALIKRLPPEGQRVLFSATLPPAIETLAGQVLHDPVRVSVAPSAAVADGIQQIVHSVERPAKRALLLQLLADPTITSAIVFVRTRHGADRVSDALIAAGIPTAVLHADKVQADRTRALDALSRGQVRVLVATDLAARGLDIPRVSHVINYDIPDIAESYVHRIGRTARAGAGGVAISFCASDERGALLAIERLTKATLPRAPLTEAPPPRLPLTDAPSG